MNLSGSRTLKIIKGGSPTTWALLVFLISVVVYSFTLTHGFVFDDQPVVVNNVFIRSLGQLWEIFSTTYWAGSGQQNWVYRPFTILSFALNYQVSGLSPWSYHLVNIVIHGFNCGLVLTLARRWGLPLVASVIGALLFAVHPIHVEAVAAVVGRGDLLVTFFLLSMALLHPWAVRRGAWAPALPAVAFLLGMFSKETGAVGLVLVLLQDFVVGRADPKGAPPLSRVIASYLTYSFALFIFLFIRHRVVGGFTIPGIALIDNPLAHATAGVRVMTAISLIGKGLWLQIFPMDLSADYSFASITHVQGPLDLRFLASALAMFLVIFLVAFWRRIPALPMAAGWYLVSLIPVANLFFPIGTIFGERLLYLPSVGFCLGAALALVSLGNRLANRVSPKLFWGLLSILLVAEGARTITYSLAWADNYSLFSHAVGIVPDSVKVQYNLGAAFRDVGRFDEAEKNWLRAIAIYPDHVESLGDLGSLNLMRGEEGAARGFLERAVAVAPERASAWYNLALLHRRAGDTRAWRECLEKFVAFGAEEFPEEVQKVRASIDAISE